MSKVSFNIDTIFGITLIVLLLWLVGWWVAIGWKKNERRGWSLNRRMVTSIFLFLFSIGSMIIISWRYINDRLPIDFGGLMISVGALFGIYSLGLEKGTFHRYKGFWIYLLGGIVSLVWWIFLIYIDYIK